MKLICGEMSPASGRIDMPRDLKIGYLPQIMEHNRGKTVLEETMSVFGDIRKTEREVESINAALAERTDYESPEYASLIARLGELNDLLSMDSGESPEVRTQKTLLGLGFRDGDFTRPTETLSQGWNMRIELAKILLSGPDMLLLDEPTNHLDIESIEWFEDYLQRKYRGALLLAAYMITKCRTVGT